MIQSSFHATLPRIACRIPRLRCLLFWLLWLTPLLTAATDLPPIEDFLQAQIGEDLADAQISREMIEATWQEAKTASIYNVRFQKMGTRLQADSRPEIRTHPRYYIMSEALHKLIETYPIPDFDLIMHLGDGLDTNPYLCPIFVFAKHRDGLRLILTPDPEALNPLDRNYLSSLMATVAEEIPWENKEPKAFWRGSPTGPAPSLTQIYKKDFSTAPRFQLVYLSQHHPEKIDATFTSLQGLFSVNQSQIEKTFPMTPPINPKDHLIYKYLPDIDGHSCCYSRTFWILASNSLLLKQETPYRQWYYKGLKPFVHFVPIQHRLDGLLNVLDFCRNHDALVKEIALEGSRFAYRHLTYEQNILYLAHLITTYTNHLQDPTQFGAHMTEAKVAWVYRVYFQCKNWFQKTFKKQPISYMCHL
jgi:hypothetical protein